MGVYLGMGSSRAAFLRSILLLPTTAVVDNG